MLLGWDMQGMPMLNNAGESIGKVAYPMEGFENGWMKAPVASSKAKALAAISDALTAIAKL